MSLLPNLYFQRKLPSMDVATIAESNAAGVESLLVLLDTLVPLVTPEEIQAIRKRVAMATDLAPFYGNVYAIDWCSIVDAVEALTIRATNSVIKRNITEVVWKDIGHEVGVVDIIAEYAKETNFTSFADAATGHCH